MLKKVDDGNGGKWIIKKKFAFAGATLLFGALIAAKGVFIASTVEHVITLIAGFGTFSGGILTLIFAADITDKKLNNGTYE